jgi:hypothetical protein
MTNTCSPTWLLIELTPLRSVSVGVGLAASGLACNCGHPGAGIYLVRSEVVEVSGVDKPVAQSVQTSWSHLAISNPHNRMI